MLILLGINYKKIKHYIKILFYSGVFWVCMAILHLGSLNLEAFQSGKFNYPSANYLAMFISAYFSWSLLTTFFYFLIEKHPPAKGNLFWVLQFILVSLVWLLMVPIIRDFLTVHFMGGRSISLVKVIVNESPFLYVFNFFKTIMTYCACAGIFFYTRMHEEKLSSLRFQREAAQALERNSRYQLQALQAQLSPHFLFNSLNSISAMARNQESARIVKVVASLADLLRYAIEGSRQTQVLLSEELKFTKDYIALQSVRFDGCFTFNCNTNSLSPSVFCPPFCIQTLVENVFAHTEMVKANPIAINLTIEESNFSCLISVENSPVIPTDNEGAGTSLKNLRERLVLLYGPDARLDTYSDEHKFVVRILFSVGQVDD
ncbi:histidine kinase [Cellvibrio sp. OA-2007]